MAAGNHYRLDWSVLDSYFELQELSSAPATPQSNDVRLYAKDSSGTSTLCYKNDAGTEVCLPTSGTIVTGSGAAGQVAFWSAASVITGENDFFWDATNNRLGLVTATPAETLDVRGNVRYGTGPGFYWNNTQLDLILGDAQTTQPGSALVGRGLAVVRASTTAEVDIYGYSGTGMQAGLRLLKPRGSVASPTATQTDDGGFIAFGGYTSASAFLYTAAQITGQAAENWTGSAQGSYLTFHTTAIGATSLTERVRVGPSGQLGIGGATYGTSGNLLRSNGSGSAISWQDHTLDFLSQYALLAGRSGGQTLIGGTAVGDDLTLQSTSGNGNNDDCIIGKVGNNGATQFFKASVNSGFFIGNGTTPGSALSIATTGSSFAGGDWIAWFRRENTAANNESIIRHQHFSDVQVPQPLFAGMAARGTNASPTTLSAGDYLLILDGRGYDGSATNHGEYAVGWSDTSAQIAMRAGGTWSGTDHESYISFYTTPDASVTPAERFRIASNGFLGHLGAASNPLATQHGAADADYSVVWDAYSSAAATTSPALVARRARGTQASPSAVNSGDVLFTFQARGYGTSFPVAGGAIVFVASQTWTGSANGAETHFQITTNGTTAFADAWYMLNDGSWQAKIAGSNIDLASLTGRVFKMPTDNTDPTAGGGAATGRIPIDVGGNLKYIPYY